MKDVGAVMDRPRAIDDRPYALSREIFLFYNSPCFCVVS